jgi:hypothetical protein
MKNTPNFGEAPEQVTPDSSAQAPDSRQEAAMAHTEMVDTLDSAYHERVVEELTAFKEKTEQDIASLEEQVEDFCINEAKQQAEDGEAGEAETTV